MYPSQVTKPLNLNFAGGFPRPVLNQLSAADRRALEGLILKDCIDYVLYDTKYIKGATAVGTAPFTFFQVQQGVTDQVINDSAISYTKTAQETNMTQAGQLARGRMLIVESIQCRVTVPGNLDVSSQSTGNTTLPNATGTAATLDATHSAIVVSNLEVAVLNSLFIQMKTGEKTYEEGPAYQFPSEFGISGYASGFELGTVTAGSNISMGESVANNGFGKARCLRIPRVILPGQNFSVPAQFFNNLTPGRPFAIQVLYRGLLFRDVQ